MQYYKINYDGGSAVATSANSLTDDEIRQKALEKGIGDQFDTVLSIENITDDEDEKAAFADVTYSLD